MSQSKKARVRLDAIDERIARLRAERDRLAARASKTARRLETRLKIVIGGTVLAAVEHEGLPALRTQADLTRWLDARLDRQDRRAFDLPPQSGRPLQDPAFARLRVRCVRLSRVLAGWRLRKERANIPEERR